MVSYVRCLNPYLSFSIKFVRLLCKCMNISDSMGCIYFMCYMYSL